MRKHNFFITSTGTGVGKTFLSCALIEAARARNLRCHAVKPVISGFTPEAVMDSDTGRIMQSLGLSHDEANLNSISPWRYKAALSPDLAAKREGDTIGFDDLTEFCLQSASRPLDLFLIEGVGGVMVPLDNKHTVADWMHALGIPAIVVVGTYLGAISHALTTMSALYSHHIPIKAVVVNESLNSTVSVADTIDSLKNFIKQIPIMPLYRNAKLEPSDAAFGQLFEFLFKDVLVKELA